MPSVNSFRWKGSDRIYTLPWLKNKLEFTSDPERIQEFAKCPFSRSKFVMTMISEFHLSQNSIVVSDDDHAIWLKRLSRAHMPKASEMPAISKDLMDRIFKPLEGEGAELKMGVHEPIIRELYRTMLDKMLNVEVLPELDNYIAKTRFPPGHRAMITEGVLLSLRFHTKFFTPIRYTVNRIFFKKVLYMRRLSKKLEGMIVDHTIPRPGSWYNTLFQLRSSGKLTQEQFDGEITAMLVSSYSVASALGSMILSLAARPSYYKKIKEDPSFAKYFVMEVLRLYPPFRQFGYEKILEKDGVRAKKSDGHEFLLATWLLQKNPDLWDKPKIFYPERFLDPKVITGLKYLPFGMGKRSCPGRRFSLAIMTESLKYICSEESGISFSPNEKMPIGRNGRLVSFAIDDVLTYRRAEKAAVEIQELEKIASA